MKPFNLELAKDGRPVCTRDGHKARIICFDAEGKYPIVALVKEDDGERVSLHTEKGFYFANNSEHNRNLMMASEKKEGWINVYKNGRTSFIYETKEEAFVNHLDTHYLDTVKIEWEE